MVLEGKLLYKSDGTTSRFIAGTPDFCGLGCLIVQGIRVPFPTCTTHSMTVFNTPTVIDTTVFNASTVV